LLEHALFGSSTAQPSSDRCRSARVRRNKQKGRGLSRRPAILSPLPPCLAGHSGRSRRTDRLRPNFLGGSSWRRLSLWSEFFPARHSLTRIISSFAAPAHVIRQGAHDSKSTATVGIMHCGRRPKSAVSGMAIEGLRHRLPFARPRLASEEQRLARDGRDDR
jgi:hypothetical protein